MKRKKRSNILGEIEGHGSVFQVPGSDLTFVRIDRRARLGLPLRAFYGLTEAFNYFRAQLNPPLGTYTQERREAIERRKAGNKRSFPIGKLARGRLLAIGICLILTLALPGLATQGQQNQPDLARIEAPKPGRCAGITRAREQCQMPAKVGAFCRLHDPKAIRCGAPTKTRGSCKIVVKAEGQRCHIHRPK